MLSKSQGKRQVSTKACTQVWGVLITWGSLKKKFIYPIETSSFSPIHKKCPYLSGFIFYKAHEMHQWGQNPTLQKPCRALGF
jgi:hypothetical protein